MVVPSPCSRAHRTVIHPVTMAQPAPLRGHRSPMSRVTEVMDCPRHPVCPLIMLCLHDFNCPDLHRSARADATAGHTLVTGSVQRVGSGLMDGAMRVMCGRPPMSLSLTVTDLGTASGGGEGEGVAVTTTH